MGEGLRVFSYCDFFSFTLMLVIAMASISTLEGLEGVLNKRVYRLLYRL